MNAFTIDDVLSWGPCNPPYSRNYIKKLFADRKTINEFDIDAMPIKQEDKGWALGQMLPWDESFKFPEGVTYLWVLNNAALTALKVPEGVTDLWVENNGTAHD
jgi:hypothetical protein